MGARISARRARRAYARLWEEPERRVIACVKCGASRPFRGHVAALIDGWVWNWVKGKSVWVCPARHEVSHGKR